MEPNKNNKLAVPEIQNWPQAAFKIVEVTLNRSLIGGIFIIFMVGVYYFASDLMQMQKELVTECVKRGDDQR